MQAVGDSAVFFGAVPLELAEGGDGQGVDFSLVVAVSNRHAHPTVFPSSLMLVDPALRKSPSA